MIRLLTPTDSQDFQKLTLLSLKTDPEAFLTTLEQESKYLPINYVNRIRFATKAPIFGIYGFFQNSMLIAVAQLADEYHFKMKHLANIYGLYVHPDHRKKSLATKLLTHLISQAKKAPQLEQIHLRANSDNQPAIALYLSLGFSHFATRKQAVKEADNTYQDELLFSLKLK